MAGFTSLGLWCWSQYATSVYPHFGAPDAGLDSLAWSHLGLDHGAAVLRREIALTPPDAALLVVGPGEDWTLTEVYYLISYLAWPRPVWCVGSTLPGRHARFENPPPPGLKASELFFYKISPPPGVGARSIGDHLAVLRSPP